MASHFRMFDRPLGSGGSIAPLSVTGDLEPYNVGEAYESRLKINNSVGRCTVAVLESDLPDGATVRVDNVTKEVVVKWPAYQVVEDTDTVVPNGDFEAGDDGRWTLGPGWTIEPGFAYDGTYSAKFADIKTKGSDIASALVPAKVNDYITATAKFCQGNSTKGQAGGRLIMTFYDADGNTLQNNSSPMFNGGPPEEFMDVTAQGGAPANTASVGVRFACYRNKRNFPMWVDHVVWTHKYTIGSNEGGTRCLTIAVTDGINRVAGWSGCTTDEDEPAATCDIEREFTGGNSFPTTIDVVLGSGVGKVQLDWLVGAAPDKFVVIYDGKEVINTGFRGYKDQYQAGLNTILARNGLPPEEILPGDVLTPDSSLPGGYSHSGTDYFQKTTAHPITATLLVYGGSSGTEWTCNLSCPDSSAALFLTHRLPSAEMAIPYSGKFSGIGGTGLYTNYAVTAGTLPPGLVLDGATGAVDGTPTTAGSFAFTVTVTDSLGATFSDSVTLVISDRMSLPLTYDESQLSGSALTWTRLGDSPLATTRGGEFNGYNDRLVGSNLPSWMTGAGAGLTMDVFVTPARGRVPGTVNFQCAAGIGAATGTAPRIWVGRTRATGYDGLADWLHVGTGSGATPWKRVGWTSRGQYPELYVNNQVCKPQAVMFLDADTILVTAHYNDQLSRAHRIKLSTGEVTGQFDFPAPYVHVASCARSASGNVWFGEYITGTMLKVDLAASFDSGTAAISTVYTLTGINGAGAIEFAIFDGIEYVLAAEYGSGTTYLYIFPFSLATGGGNFTVGQETRRYRIPSQTQGIRMWGGHLYTTHGNSGVAGGGIIRSDSFGLSAANDTAIPQSVVEPAPSQYPEDLDFHPTTGDLWTSTEGYNTTGQTGWTCLWSRKFGSINHPESRFTVSVTEGGNLLAVEVDGHYHGTQSISPTGTAAAVFVGGYADAAAGYSAGFWSGHVRDLVILPGIMSSASRKAGRRDSRQLTEYVLTLANDATTESVVGWTNEVGAVSTRTSSPPPFIGTGYLYDAANPETKAVQRAAVPPLPNGGYARMRWMQATYTSGNDTSGGGVRSYAGETQTGESLAESVIIPTRMTWVQRSHALSVNSATTEVAAIVTMARFTGTSSDGYTNAVELVVYAK